MNSNDTECRRAFYRFLEELRLETFSMYERLREIERAGDDDMESRMQTLALVGTSASHVHANIEELFAAVWFGSEEAAPIAPAFVPRQPVAVR